MSFIKSKPSFKDGGSKSGGGLASRVRDVEGLFKKKKESNAKPTFNGSQSLSSTDELLLDASTKLADQNSEPSFVRKQNQNPLSKKKPSFLRETNVASSPYGSFASQKSELKPLKFNSVLLPPLDNIPPSKKTSFKQPDIVSSPTLGPELSHEDYGIEVESLQSSGGTTILESPRLLSVKTSMVGPLSKRKSSDRSRKGKKRNNSQYEPEKKSGSELPSGYLKSEPLNRPMLLSADSFIDAGSERKTSLPSVTQAHDGIELSRAGKKRSNNLLKPNQEIRVQRSDSMMSNVQRLDSVLSIQSEPKLGKKHSKQSNSSSSDDQKKLETRKASHVDPDQPNQLNITNQVTTNQVLAGDGLLNADTPKPIEAMPPSIIESPVGSPISLVSFQESSFSTAYEILHSEVIIDRALKSAFGPNTKSTIETLSELLTIVSDDKHIEYRHLTSQLTESFKHGPTSNINRAFELGEPVTYKGKLAVVSDRIEDGDDKVKLSYDYSISMIDSNDTFSGINVPYIVSAAKYSLNQLVMCDGNLVLISGIQYLPEVGIVYREYVDSGGLSSNKSFSKCPPSPERDRLMEEHSVRQLQRDEIINLVISCIQLEFQRNSYKSVTSLGAWEQLSEDGSLLLKKTLIAYCHHHSITDINPVVEAKPLKILSSIKSSLTEYNQSNMVSNTTASVSKLSTEPSSGQQIMGVIFDELIGNNHRIKMKRSELKALHGIVADRLLEEIDSAILIQMRVCVFCNFFLYLQTHIVAHKQKLKKKSKKKKIRKWLRKKHLLKKWTKPWKKKKSSLPYSKM